MNSRLCLESEDVRMVGIVGLSGVGKSTIGRELFTLLSKQFPYSVFTTYKRTSQDNCDMKLDWAKQFLSDILDEENIKIHSLVEVEQRLKDKKVLIVLDDVVELALLETLVLKTEWFGRGSRIIVITQDKHLIKAQKIDDIYEVKLPSDDLALEMFCQSAFEQKSPPNGFIKLSIEVVKLAGNLPLGLSVLGSTLKGRDTRDWMEMLPRLRNILDGDIGKTLRVSYDRLDKEDQHLFLYVACIFSRSKWINTYIQDVLRDGRVNIELRILAEKSLIRITTPDETVDMHEKLLGREIVRAESIDPGNRRFLMDVDDIRDVLTYNIGTGNVLGIYLETPYVEEAISIHEKSFKRMHNLRILIILSFRREGKVDLPQSLNCLPRKLEVLWWNFYPAEYLPSTFKAEYLVKLIMIYSELRKLWEGTQLLRHLRVMDVRNSKYLEVIPDLSKAINLESLNLSDCISLVTLLSWIQNLTKLLHLDMEGCEKLETIPTLFNLASLEYLNFYRCPRLKNFPEILIELSEHKFNIVVKNCLSKNLSGLSSLDCLLGCMPSHFHPEHYTHFTVKDSMFEKLWEGAQSLGSLVRMDLSECVNLTEFPNLSKATNLEELILNECKSLVMVPSTIGNLQKLKLLSMENCKALKVLPIDVNLSSLTTITLSGCSRLKIFPSISNSIEYVNLEHTAIEGVPCFIEDFSRLRAIEMYGCKRLKNISPNIFRLTSLKIADFVNCGGVSTALSDATAVTITEDCIPLYENIGESYNIGKMSIPHRYHEKENTNGLFGFINCFKLDEDARELIVRSCFQPTILPGDEVPTYFKHRASGFSLTIILPQRVLSQEFLRVKACVVVKHPSSLLVKFSFNGVHYEEYDYGDMYMKSLCETDHLILCSFKFRPTGLPSNRDVNYVDFWFKGTDIKECGVQFLNVSLSPDGSDGNNEIEYNQRSEEKCDVVETGRSKKKMPMTSATSRENSSVFFYPCVEREAFCFDRMITKQQDTVIHILEPLPRISGTSIYSGGLGGGIEAHIEALNSRLCLESEEVRVVGIAGPSGIGKSTIGRELFTQLSKQFPYSVFATYKRTSQNNCDMNLNWANQFLSEILGEENIKIRSLVDVEQRLKDKKVLIVLDDVVELALLETLVGKTEWFGRGSRIIVITQDKHLLKAHKIDVIYEVELSPDSFTKLTSEVAKRAGNLPLALGVLGDKQVRMGAMLSRFRYICCDKDVERILSSMKKSRWR